MLKVTAVVLDTTTTAHRKLTRESYCVGTCDSNYFVWQLSDVGATALNNMVDTVLDMRATKVMLIYAVIVALIITIMVDWV